jgi:mono/diheme cytochrome c family protein
VVSVLASASVQAQDGSVRRGKEVFLERAEPRCGVCHTLADAGTVGNIGPNLDELKPTEDQVKMAVMNGLEAMPAYGEQLSKEEIDVVSKYVAQVAGRM